MGHASLATSRPAGLLLASSTICLLVVLVADPVSRSRCQAASVATQKGNGGPSANDRDYWLTRKAEFYAKTRFPLSDLSLRLLGPKRLIFSSDVLLPSGHLPFWFDYELFKKVFNKPQVAPSEQEEKARHRVFLNTCIRVLKRRVLYRVLAATRDAQVTSDANRVSVSAYEPSLFASSLFAGKIFASSFFASSLFAASFFAPIRPPPKLISSQPSHSRAAP